MPAIDAVRRHTGRFTHERPRRAVARAGIRVLAAALALAGCAPAGGRTAPAPARSPLAALRAGIDSLLDRPMFRTAEWGALVVDPARGETLYARRPATLMVPASNMKIVTAGAALTLLGPDYRYRTSFMAHGPVANGVLQGDLVVIGRGDPSLSDRMRGSARAAMAALADSVIARGVRTVRGRIYSGADNFPGPHAGESWEWDDLPYAYGAGVDELLFNEGMSRMIVYGLAGDSSVYAGPAAEPTLDYLRELELALRSRGVRVEGGVGESIAPADATPLTPLFTLVSPPLRDILRALLKPSQNQIAEVLLRTLGLERTGVGTADSGAAVVARQLTAWGVPADGYQLHDGSGLARADLVSPETLVRVLTVMRASPDFAVFYAALPVAGVDGTIARRMQGTPAAANVHAKTGSLGWVRSLSGYVTDAAGHQLVFSLLANKWTTPPDSVTRTADRIAAALAAYRQ